MIWINEQKLYLYCAFSGAQVDIKDHLGRNFLHLTVQQPYGLSNLQPEFMQVIYLLCMNSQKSLCSAESKLILLIMIFIIMKADSGILKLL